MLSNIIEIMDYGFTAKIEGEFDEVANGKLQWNDMLEEFYGPFKKDVDNTIENAERVKGERILGADPESGKPDRFRVFAGSRPLGRNMTSPAFTGKACKLSATVPSAMRCSNSA